MARIPVPEHKTVTGIYYAEQVLPVVVNHYMATRPPTGVRGLMLLHDNAPAHCSAVVQDYLKIHGFKTLPHPAYSPDLAPCDFWLNPVIKKCLSGREFETCTTIGRALFHAQTVYLNLTIKAHSNTGLNAWKKCVEVKGEYFEGLD